MWDGPGFLLPEARKQGSRTGNPTFSSEYPYLIFPACDFGRVDIAVHHLGGGQSECYSVNVVLGPPTLRRCELRIKTR